LGRLHCEAASVLKTLIRLLATLAVAGAALIGAIDTRGPADAEEIPPEAPATPAMNPYWFERTRAIAKQYWLGDYFVRQIMQESSFANDVIYGERYSWAGAAGIAQIMPDYHPGVNPLDPEAALNYAARHMHTLLLRYDGNVPKALAAYNAGAGTVDEAIATEGENWLSWMPLESQEYVAKIIFRGEPEILPMWGQLKQWWFEAANRMGQQMHLRLFVGSMVTVAALPPPPNPLY
jgi:hypothetical protein